MQIVFDLDGTLHKSDIIYVKSFKKVFLKHTGQLLDDKIIKSNIGKKPTTIWIENSTLSLNEIEQYKNEVRDEMIALIDSEATLYEGVLDLLSTLKLNHELILLSNCSVDYMNKLVSKFKLNSYFTVIIPTEKYDYDTKQNILKKLNITPTLVIGDTISDVNIAKEFKIPYIHCNYGYGNLDIPGVNSVEELELKIRELSI